MLEATVANPFFSALMSGMSDEAYLVDAHAMQLACVSSQALVSHQCTLKQLHAMPLHQVLGMPENELVQWQAQCVAQPHGVPLTTLLLPKVEGEKGRRAGDSTKVSFFEAEGKPWMLVMKNSVSRSAMQALDDSESRFQAIVTNTPGLVFQFRLLGPGRLGFIYLSEACYAVLGITEAELTKTPSQFYRLMAEEDRPSFREALLTSANEMTVLNWEGRIWIKAWQDTKWINLRGSPIRLHNGEVQWGGIITNITQSKNEKLEIERSRQRMAELSAHLTQVKEQERRRIAREIHDDLGGNLTAIKIGLTSIIKRINPDEPKLVEKALNLESIVDRTFDIVHRIASDLRPDVLELGIVAALEWQCGQFEKQFSLPCRFYSSQTELAVSADEAITLFRICQEAMSNIAKHAKARQVEVELLVEDRDIILRIVDDGQGIRMQDQHKSNSFGLRGMRERVAALDGSLEVEKRVRGGTAVQVKIPRSLK